MKGTLAAHRGNRSGRWWWAALVGRVTERFALGKPTRAQLDHSGGLSDWWYDLRPVRLDQRDRSAYQKRTYGSNCNGDGSGFAFFAHALLIPKAACSEASKSRTGARKAPAMP